MNHSPDISTADASEQVRLLLQAPDFKKLCQLSTELSAHRKFNVFRFADKTISENAWSRVFAWLLNSTEDHDLGTLPFKTWLQLGFEEQLGVTEFARNEDIILTRTEVPTEEGRRIDILVNVLDNRSRTKAVIGIENKVWSREQDFQVADYQADLNKRSPHSAIKRLVFLTPDGRKSTTADDNSRCKCVPASYNTITDLCGALSRSKKCNRNLVNLLKQMKSYLEKEITGTRETKKLVHRLYAEKKYRAALRVISQNMPSTFDVFAKLKEHVENALRKRKVEPPSWWPPQGGNPHDVRLIPTELGRLTKRGRGRFEVNYSLTCDEDEPDIGDRFKLIVAAYCYNKAAVQKAKEFRGTPPETRPWREDTRWFWVTIWIGNEYRLKDLGRADAKALSILVIDAIDQTYSRLLRKAARMRT
jgi:hypothetical protein